MDKHLSKTTAQNQNIMKDTDKPHGLTRRNLLTGASAIAASPWLTACGGGGESVLEASANTLEDKGAFSQAIVESLKTKKSLWYDSHANEWLEALPIGNGRLGAMLYAGAWNEKIQFNENSLWGGASDVSSEWSGYEDNQFGGYRNFGHIQIDWDGSFKQTVSSPTGHIGNINQTVANTIDNDTSSKWCVETRATKIAWLVDLGASKRINQYNITSADDVPNRDPNGWEMYGSKDGLLWNLMDRRVLTQPFSNRKSSYTYKLTAVEAYRYVKFEFVHDSSVSHFQISGIELNGFETSAIYPILTSPSGDGEKNRYSNNEDISKTLDGNENTKWCIEGPGKEVIWQYECTRSVLINAFSLTSANDAPRRDPSGWTFMASNDGINWTQLHSQPATSVFTSRREKKLYSISNAIPYKFYKFVFVQKTPDTHFQLANVELIGPAYSSNKSEQPYTISNYERVLDLNTGTHLTSFQRDGLLHRQTAFASRKDDVIVIRYDSLRTDGSGNLSGQLKLQSAQSAKTIYTSQGASFSGVLSNSLKYGSKLIVLNEGGNLSSDGTSISFQECKSIIIVLDARTNYEPSYSAKWRNTIDPVQRSDESVKAANNKGWAVLYSAHKSEFNDLMSRVNVVWGSEQDTKITDQPTNRRKASYKNNPTDTELEQIIFDYGRYLLFSSSRTDSLPANLQGLWNKDNRPEWASDYHNNINVQMNYWGAEVCDMGDSHLGLVNYLKAQAPSLRIATRDAFKGAPGWTARTMQNIFGSSTYTWNPVSSAWYALHIWEHYAFTQDINYLQNTAYPLITEIVQFWEHQLIEVPQRGESNPRYTAELEAYKQISIKKKVNSVTEMDISKHIPGTYITPVGWSPEIGPYEMGIVYDIQIVWDLFQNFLDASKALNIDTAFTKKIKEMQGKLAPYKVDSKGRLQEWQQEREPYTSYEPIKVDLVHRHTSNLYAVYPGRQITVSKTPELSKAALVSLKERCNEQGGIPLTAASQQNFCRSWTWPWKAALFARFGDGNRAGEMVRGLLCYSTTDNLFANHTHAPAVFQMDGNFGITGAIPEMLLQSHEEQIHLLPALPEYWKSKGSFKGLRARGGYRVNCEWINGVVVNFSIINDRGTPNRSVSVVCNGVKQTVLPQVI